MNIYVFFKEMIEAIMTPGKMPTTVYVFMFLICMLIFCGGWILIHLVTEKKNSYEVSDKKKFSLLYSEFLNVFPETKRQYNIEPFYIDKGKRKKISFEGYLSLCIMASVFLGLFYAVIAKAFIPIPVILSIPIGGVLSWIMIQHRYTNRYQKFEKGFHQIGAVFKNSIKTDQTRKDIPEILEAIIELNLEVVTEDFQMVLNNYIENKDILAAIALLIERYPQSNYVERFVDFFWIYKNHRSDISSVIDVTTTHLQNNEENKKKADIEILPYIKMLMILAFIGYSAWIFFMITNPFVRAYYFRREGIAALIVLNLFIATGVMAVLWIKMQVTRDEFVKRKKV